MTNGYNKIVNATYDHAVDLELLSNTQTRKLLVDIRKLQKDLKQQLRKIDPTSPHRPIVKQRRLEKYTVIANELISNVYKKLEKDQKKYLKEVGKMENTATKNIVNDSLNDDILTVDIDPNQLNILSRKTLIEGLPADAWFAKKLPVDLKSIIVRNLQTGIAQNETIQQLTSRINKRVDIEKRHVETLVRTSTNAVTNKVRDEVYIANDDVIEGEEHLATLDLRTSSICRERDGLAWTIPAHKPLGGHGQRWRPFPLHFNERSTWMPVFRDIDKITGVDTSKWSKGTRATMDGPQKAGLNYSQWFDNQPESRQIQVLGKQKLDLYKKNNLSMRDMTRVDGSALTIEQLTTKVNRKGFKPKLEVVPIPGKPKAPEPKKKVDPVGTSLEVDANGNPRPRIVNNFEKRWTEAGAVKNKDIESMFNRFDSPNEIVDKSKGAYFAPWNKKISMDKSNDVTKIGNKETYVHEYSHYIDTRLGSIEKFSKVSANNLYSAGITTDKKSISSATKVWYKASSNDIKPTTGGWANVNNRWAHRSNTVTRKLDSISDRKKISLDDSYNLFIKSGRTDLPKDKSIYGDLFRSKEFDFKDDNRLLYLYNASKDNDISYLVDMLGTSGPAGKVDIQHKLSDMVCSTTTNDLGYGHSKSYNKSGKAGTEVFAEAIVMINEGGIWEKLARYLAPNIMKETDNIINKYK